jgi:hypothetical protein
MKGLADSEGSVVAARVEAKRRLRDCDKECAQAEVGSPRMVHSKHLNAEEKSVNSWNEINKYAFGAFNRRKESFFHFSSLVEVFVFTTLVTWFAISRFPVGCVCDG